MEDVQTSHQKENNYLRKK